MKSVLLFVLLPLLLCFIVKQQILHPKESLDLHLVEFQEKLNSTSLDAVNWPFTEGPDAPYDLKPTGLSLNTLPKKGYSNGFVFNFTMRQQVCDYWYGWEATLNGKVVDYFYHTDVKGCLKTNLKYRSTANISTFVNGPSGNYTFRIFYDDDTDLGEFADVRFSVAI